MREAIEEFIGDLDEPRREALLLSARHSYATCAEKLGIETDEVGRHVDDAHELVTRRLLGTTGWEDAVARSIAIMRIDQVAIRLQKGRESVWYRLGAMLERGPWPVPVPVRAVGAVGAVGVVLFVGGGYQYYAGVMLPRGASDGTAVVADRRGADYDGEELLGRMEAEGVRAAGVGSSPPPSSAPQTPLPLPPPRGGLSAAESGLMTPAVWREGYERKWAVDTVGGWQEVSTGNSADIGGVEEGNARAEELIAAIGVLWRAGAESDSQESIAFGRQLEEFVRARAGEGIAEYCAASQWQVARRSRGAQEEERGKLEIRRRELENERRELELDRREWDVTRREKEVKRRELEGDRRDAEAKRDATEARSGPDSEKYWQGMGAYEQALEGYVSEFDGLETFEEQYSSFMNDTYVAGQHRYLNGIAEVIVGYSALLWGCETERQLV